VRLLLAILFKNLFIDTAEIHKPNRGYETVNKSAGNGLADTSRHEQQMEGKRK
jgi:hypothetical protein